MNRYCMNKIGAPILVTSAQHRTMFATTLVLVVIDSIWCFLGRWDFEVRELYPSLIAVALMLFPLALSRYRRDPKINALCKCAALLICFSVGAGVLSYLVVGTNAPLVDKALDHWDKALGFDWVKFYLWVQHYPWLQRTLVFAYASALPQMAVVLVFLSFTERGDQLVDFTTTLAISFIITVVISGFFPAGEASELHFAVVPTDISMHTQFAEIRDGSLRTIHLLHMQGLISMPSFHAVLAMVLTYAMRRTRLAVPFIVLNALVLLSTPTEGGHYLVDMFGGILTAAIAIFVARSPAFKRLLSLPTAAPIYRMGSTSSLPERPGL